MVGIIPSLSDASAVVVDSQPSSVYPIVLLNLAVLNGCSPIYQQQTVAMTPYQLTTAYGSLTTPDTLAQREKSCEDAVVSCTSNNLIAQLYGEPPVCDPNQVANQFASTYTVNVTVVGYILNEHFSLNNRFPAKITSVRAKVGGQWTDVGFQETSCAPQCTFNVILNFTTTNASTPTTVTFFVDTEIPVGWGIPPVWFGIVWLPKTYQASALIPSR